MKILWTQDLDSKIYHDALLIRYQVFVDEQHVPKELEIDDAEASSIHGVIYASSQPIATVRLFPLDTRRYKIQRVAVLKTHRKRGIGNMLMHEVEVKLKKETSQPRKLIVDSQNPAIPFYKQLGYQTASSEFMDAGIPHHRMIKEI